MAFEYSRAMGIDSLMLRFQVLTVELWSRRKKAAEDLQSWADTAYVGAEKEFQAALGMLIGGWAILREVRIVPFWDHCRLSFRGSWLNIWEASGCAFAIHSLQGPEKTDPWTLNASNPKA